jgi:hypothetical protein
MGGRMGETREVWLGVVFGGCGEFEGVIGNRLWAGKRGGGTSRGAVTGTLGGLVERWGQKNGGVEGWRGGGRGRGRGRMGGGEGFLTGEWKREN